MYVCLCTGVCSEVVRAAIAGGAATTKEVSAVCGAGGECGRCRMTVRAMIEAHFSQTHCQEDSARFKLPSTVAV
ncbi:(2Fe-2S)-binding protein [Mycolicibacterium moriokaense]|uniref:Bacterioferritin-associated ferredoxin n=1 Tax=Mycolicibacterium moriokaense TaxID=39691 RepID=A0AAD1HC15_9MYCO|nr:(2Fe-2S)-binding protein [Mycolicibacterium moriokaense]MCV7038215.1 (2Fe-2S)-binding protein [Mycolicibacterium moriokaense]ORB24206.1 (2Fe-2S)-binding protein [Mycolicibacterium moriokaense]BBX02668.1 hypothetical protein MMOR_36040 [Mycolicibacterium moriokaense]